MTDLNKDAAELETVLGVTAKTLEIRGQTITVREFTLEQLPQILRLIAKIRKAGRQIVTWTDPDSGASVPLEKDDFITAALEHGEEVVELIHLATANEIRLRKMQIGVTDTFALLGAIFEVNASFFDLTRNAEAGGILASLLTGSQPQNGQSSSASSPDPATASTTSGK